MERQPPKANKVLGNSKRRSDAYQGVIVSVLGAAQTSSGVLGPFCF